MGLGLWTTEQLRYDQDTGRLLDNNTWHYHVPTCQDIPCDLRTSFYNSGYNPRGVLGSKTTGEPSVLAGVSVMSALRMAILSAREDAGLKQWFQFGQLTRQYEDHSSTFITFQMVQQLSRTSRLPALCPLTDFNSKFQLTWDLFGC